jgi:hypothetical protein
MEVVPEDIRETLKACDALAAQLLRISVACGTSPIKPAAFGWVNASQELGTAYATASGRLAAHYRYVVENLDERSNQLKNGTRSIIEVDRNVGGNLRMASRDL